MLRRPVRFTHIGAIVLSSVLVVLVLLLGLRWGHSEAQGIMSAPACQCSAPTTIANMSINVVHCVCGGMSCVIGENTGQGKSSNLMQCVK